MNEDISQLVLNGLPFSHFLIFLGWACFGDLVSYYLHANHSRRKDPNTPTHFSWKLFFKGMRRMIIAVALMAFFIIFWDEISGFAFKLLFDIDTPAELNGFSAAVVVGGGCDNIAKAVFGGGKDAAQFIKKRMGK